MMLQLNGISFELIHSSCLQVSGIMSHPGGRVFKTLIIIFQLLNPQVKRGVQAP
jgi:hypothetical protein